MTPVLALLTVPAAGAVLAAVLPTRHRPLTALVTITVTLGLAVASAQALLRSGEAVVVVGPAGAGVLVADGLGVGLVLVSATVALLATAFAAAERSGAAPVRPAHWPVSLALLTGINGVVLAGDLVTAYLVLELVAVSGAVLVVLGGGRARLAAGTRFLYAEMIASLTFLLGVALVWRTAGTVALDGIADGALDSTEGRVGLALVTAGLLLKIPAFPMHFWMPAAHSLAASAVSPWLSALVVKSAFVVLLRVWATEPLAVPAVTAQQLLGALGAAAVLGGGIAALRATQVKRLVAYSTVAQLGLLLLVVPLVGAGSVDGWTGGAVHAIAHALPKAALLMAVSLLATTMGGATVPHLAGAAARRPVAVLTIGVSAVSLIGLPPTAGFVAKWYLLVGSLGTGQWWWAVTIVVGGLLTAAYLARLLQQCLRAPSSPLPSGTAVRGVADVVVLTLALLGVLLGLFPEALVGLLGIGAPGGGAAGG
jgi:formate hydrogenlyase subunit 3/multisubunit Na+/H+ antiporter MnhD subunit